jgi:hypothetical protein
MDRTLGSEQFAVAESRTSLGTTVIDVAVTGRDVKRRWASSISLLPQNPVSKDVRRTGCV